jgi:hypothetical protein
MTNSPGLVSESCHESTFKLIRQVPGRFSPITCRFTYDILTPGSIFLMVFWPQGQFFVIVFWTPSW